MVKATHILNQTDDFHKRITSSGEPYYEPFEDPEEYDVDEYLFTETFKTISPTTYPLNENALKRSTKLIYVIWLETETKISSYVETAQRHMSSANISEAIVLNFQTVVGDIDNTIKSLKKLNHWKGSSVELLRQKSEILHNELTNLSEYIAAFSDMHSLFSFYLEEFHSKGKENTLEYKFYSISSRSVERIHSLLELAKKATLDTMKHQKRMIGGEWKFE